MTCRGRTALPGRRRPAQRHPQPVVVSAAAPGTPPPATSSSPPPCSARSPTIRSWSYGYGPDSPPSTAPRPRGGTCRVLRRSHTRCRRCPHRIRCAAGSASRPACTCAATTATPAPSRVRWSPAPGGHRRPGRPRRRPRLLSPPSQCRLRFSPVAPVKLKLDLHDIYNRGTDIDRRAERHHRPGGGQASARSWRSSRARARAS